jgi:hypothetical protein
VNVAQVGLRLRLLFRLIQCAKQETAMFNRCVTFKPHNKLCEVFTYVAVNVERMSVLNTVQRIVTCVHPNATQRDAVQNDALSHGYTL